MSMGKKSVTIDDLAGMVQRGFEDLRGDFSIKFAKAEERIDKIDERIGRMDERLKTLDQRLVAHIALSEREHEDFYETLTDHRSRINMLEDKVAGVV